MLRWWSNGVRLRGYETYVAHATAAVDVTLIAVDFSCPFAAFSCAGRQRTLLRLFTIFQKFQLNNFLNVCFCLVLKLIFPFQTQLCDLKT